MLKVDWRGLIRNYIILGFWIRIPKSGIPEFHWQVGDTPQPWHRCWKWNDWDETWNDPYDD